MVLNLIQAGADLNTKDAKGRQFIKTFSKLFVYFVNFYDNFEIVKRTPLHIAIENGFTEMTLNLIQAGVELDTKDSSGRYFFS